jgi:hypothetical protein
MMVRWAMKTTPALPSSKKGGRGTMTAESNDAIATVLSSAVTNESMREVIALASVRTSGAELSLENARLVGAGVAMVGDELRLSDFAPGLRIRREEGRMPYPSKWSEEFADNEFITTSARSYEDPQWRVDVLLEGVRIVQGILPAAAASASNPVQALVSINSRIDQPAGLETYFVGGTVKLYQLRSDEIGQVHDQRVGVEAYVDPVAVFTADSHFVTD